MANILICDDDVDIVSALKIYLSNEDYKIYTAFTGKQALDCVKEHEIDLVLMDVMMPEMDGIAATAKLREEYNIPVILLTAKSESSDKVLGLNVGADDYVTKPFDPIEVQARVRSQLRRYTRLGGQQKREQPKDTITIGGVELNDAEKSVTVDGEPVQLTPIEFSILWYLCENQGRVVSSEELFEAVWGEKFLDNNNTVMAHIGRLREKLGEPPRKPRFIKTVWGVGYQVE
jgi:DNA-binding response OmpR family regulator